MSERKRISMREAWEKCHPRDKKVESVNIEPCDECDRLKAENQRLRELIDLVTSERWDVQDLREEMESLYRKSSEQTNPDKTEQT